MRTVDGIEAGTGAIPTPLRRFSERGTIEVCRLSEGTVAQIVDAYDTLTIQVAETVPVSARGMAAEHCYARHRLACLTASCQVARALVPMPRAVPGVASA